MFDHSDLHPAIDGPPACLRCGRPTTGRIIALGNPNSNGGRPYYFRDPCNNFSCFADMEGIEESNSDCDCGIPTRRQASRWDNDPPGALHYRCAVCGCEWLDWEYYEQGGIVRVLYGPPDEREMARDAERRIAN